MLSAGKCYSSNFPSILIPWKPWFRRLWGETKPLRCFAPLTNRWYLRICWSCWCNKYLKESRIAEKQVLIPTFISRDWLDKWIRRTLGHSNWWSWEWRWRREIWVCISRASPAYHPQTPTKLFLHNSNVYLSWK